MSNYPPEYFVSAGGFSGGASYAALPPEYEPYPSDARQQSTRSRSLGVIAASAQANYSDGDLLFIFADTWGRVGPVSSSPGTGLQNVVSKIVTYEFDVTGGNVPTPGNIEIDISGETTADEVGAEILATIGGTFDGLLYVWSPVPSEVHLRAIHAGIDAIPRLGSGTPGGAVENNGIARRMYPVAGLPLGILGASMRQQATPNQVRLGEVYSGGLWPY